MDRRCCRIKWAKLTSELPGILAWGVRGCLDWQREGLHPPTAVTAATDGYRADMDVLAAFLNDCCVIKRGATVRALSLYRAYAEWCDKSGENAENQRRFGQRLTERNFEKYANDDVWYRGIGLIEI